MRATLAKQKMRPMSKATKTADRQSLILVLLSDDEIGRLVLRFSRLSSCLFTMVEEPLGGIEKRYKDNLNMNKKELVTSIQSTKMTCFNKPEFLWIPFCLGKKQNFKLSSQSI